MNEAYRHLFEPGRIGRMQTRNRIAMPAMGTALFEPDSHISRRQIDYYAERAKGGAGIIITEATAVSRRFEPAGALEMADADVYIIPMADLADAVHDAGARLVVQLTAGMGRQAGVADPSHPPVAPSAVPAFFNPAVLCRPLTVDEIHALVEDFGNAARRVFLAGADGIEIHGHTGYLIDQFLSPLWNKRTDEYGGDLAGRLRFAEEIVQAVRRNTGPDFPVIFRVSIEHDVEGGRCLTDSLDIARRLEAAGVNALNVDAGCYESMDDIFPPTYLGDAPFAELARAIKKIVSIPVMVAGNITPENAEEILASGAADFVDSGRGLIADPDWPNKVRTGHRDEVRPCIRCNEGCIGRLLSLRTLSCSVNTQAGMERYYALQKAEQPKRVLVIGGGPAGLEAARVAALRGHRVTLMEKADALGGLLTAAATAPFKRPLKELIQYYEKQLHLLGVDVLLNTEATPERLAHTRADAVVVATGSRPLVPHIKGIDGENVVEVIDWHLGRKQLHGDNVVMAGGGLSACDAALEIAQQGKQVTIVEMLPEVAVGLNLPSRIGLMKRLALAGVKILTQHKIVEFRPNGLLTETPDGQKFVPADTVVLAFGMRPVNELAAEVKARWDEVYEVGDCVTPAKVGEAVRAGFSAGRLL